MSSSDQPLNTSVPSDLCQNKQNENQQCDYEKCSDNNISSIMLESETVTSSKSNRNQSDENDPNLKRNGNDILLVVEENDQTVVLGSVSENENNVKRGDDIQDISHIDDASCHNDQELVKDNLQNANGHCDLPALNIAVPVSAEQPNTDVSQISNGTAPQTKTLDQSNDGDTVDGAANEDKLLRSPEENSDVTTDVQNIPYNTNNQLPESSLLSNVDDDEIERNDDASDDENENFFTEHDSNEDSSEFPDIVDFDGTNEVENEEYILDTVLRKPRKERRRIVSVNDDSDPEIEGERECLLQSPTIDKNELSDGTSEEEEDIEQLIQNEKPCPKSKKISTQKLKELQTRELLRNAVVIPSSSKKKKNRIIDSDDDDENASLLPCCIDVDDIGLPDTNEDNDNDNDTDAFGDVNSILLNDIDKPDSSSIDNLNQNDSEVVSYSDENAIKSEPKDVKPSLNSLSHDIECTDFPPFPSSSSDNEYEFIPNDVYFGTPDHNKIRNLSRGKGALSKGRPTQSSHREKKIIQNEVRSTDKSRGTGRGGQPSKSDKFIDNRRYSSTSASTSSSESADDYQKSKARRKPETITIVKQPMKLYHTNSLPVRPIQKQQQQHHKRPNHQRKRDRFYDKSQDIPNSIYFGDVDVPLHVLYAYGNSDSDNDGTNLKSATTKFDASKSTPVRFSSQVSRGRGRSHTSHQLTRKPLPDNQKVRARPKVESLSPSSDQSIQTMKTFLKAAGLKNVKLNRLWEGRTRRSTRAATKRQYTYDEDEILETRTKLRNVVDSDSDFD